MMSLIRGLCAVCQCVMPLRGDGAIHVHAPLKSRCPRSGKPPGAVAPTLLGSSSAANSSTAFSLSPAPIATVGLSPFHSPPTIDSSQFQPSVKILKRIPSSLCHLAANKIVVILEDLTATNDVANHLDQVASFSSKKLGSPFERRTPLEFRGAGKQSTN